MNLFKFGGSPAPTTDVERKVEAIIKGPGTYEAKAVALENLVESVNTDSEADYIIKAVGDLTQESAASNPAPVDGAAADAGTDVDSTDPNAADGEVDADAVDPDAADPDADAGAADGQVDPAAATGADGMDPEIPTSADKPDDAIAKGPNPADGTIDGTEAVARMLQGHQEIANELHRQNNVLVKAVNGIAALQNGGAGNFDVQAFAQSIEARLQGMEETIAKALGGQTEMLSKALGDLEDNARFIKSLRTAPGGQRMNPATSLPANGMIVKDIHGAAPLGGALSAEDPGTAGAPKPRFGVSCKTFMKGLGGMRNEELQKAGVSEEQFMHYMSGSTSWDSIPKAAIEGAAQSLGIPIADTE